MKRNISFLILLSVFTVSKAQVKDSAKIVVVNIRVVNKNIFFKRYLFNYLEFILFL